MKLTFIFFSLFFFSSTMAYSQSGMTDEQILKIIADLEKSNKLIEALTKERDMYKSRFEEALIKSAELQKTLVYLQKELQNQKNITEMKNLYIKIQDAEKQVLSARIAQSDFNLQQTEIAYKNLQVTSAMMIKAHEEILFLMQQKLFEKTFRVSAVQREVSGIARVIHGKTITDRLDLNENNSYKVKAKLVRGMFLEFDMGVANMDLPNFFITLTYRHPKKGTIEYLYGEVAPVQITHTDGSVNHELKFDYANYSEGIFTLTLMYEENEKTHTFPITFKMD